METGCEQSSESEGEFRLLCTLYCARGDSTQRCASVDLSLRASVMAAECECRLGFLASGSWCEAMPLVRQLAVYCLDVAVITVSSLVRLTSIAAVASGTIAT